MTLAKRYGLPALLALAALLPAGGAAGHPHLVVGTVATFVFDADRIAAVRVTWSFDAMFSAVLLSDFDSDRDGRFDEAESARAVAAMRENLEPAGFFTALSVDDAEATTGKATDMVLGRDASGVSLTFTLPLAEPAERPASVGVFVHDPTFYIAFVVESEDPVRFDGQAPGCAFAVEEREQVSPTWGTFQMPYLSVRCPERI